MLGQCLSLATANKISQSNTWDLPLIDHLDDLIRAGPGSDGPGGATNFQRASVTLDAGIKIYGCRVDAVHNEAFRALSGFSRNGAERVEAESWVAERRNAVWRGKWGRLSGLAGGGLGEEREEARERSGRGAFLGGDVVARGGSGARRRAVRQRATREQRERADGAAGEREGEEKGSGGEGEVDAWAGACV